MRVAIALSILFAGCVTNETPATETILLDLPPLASLFPDVTMVAPGFTTILSEGDPDAAELAGTISRQYGHVDNNGATRHSLTISAGRANSVEEAAKRCSALAVDHPGTNVSTRIEEGVIIKSQVRRATEASPSSENVLAIGCAGHFTFWATEAAIGEAPIVDLAQLVNAMRDAVGTPKEEAPSWT